jgi:hypothetical protein
LDSSQTRTNNVIEEFQEGSTLLLQGSEIEFSFAETKDQKIFKNCYYLVEKCTAKGY